MTVKYATDRISQEDGPLSDERQQPPFKSRSKCDGSNRDLQTHVGLYWIKSRITFDGVCARTRISQIPQDQTWRFKHESAQGR